MGMNNSEKYQASQDFRRAGDLPVRQKTADAIEDIALGHAAVGGMSEFKLMMATLGKINAKNDDNLLLRAIAKRVLGDDLPEELSK